MKAGQSAVSGLRAGRSGPWAVLCSIILALLVAPLAFGVGEGDPITGGERNPSANQTQELNEETEIIANNDTYGTRQSNKSDNGGGAIYGCRSGAGGTPADNRPCLRSNNLSEGLAFEAETNGNLGGTIIVGEGGRQAVPLTTNATGTATGFNSDEVDGMDAQEIIAVAVQQANANVQPQYRQPGN